MLLCCITLSSSRENQPKCSRGSTIFPLVVLPSHPKDWNQTWFYCKDTSPPDENPMPGYHADCLDAKHPLPDKLTPAERKKLVPTIRRVQALLGNGLTGVDLIRCWVASQIIPLSRRPGLICSYTRGTDDPLCHSSLHLTEEAIVEMATTLVNSKYEDYNLVGLNPFCKLNPAPKVILLTSFSSVVNYRMNFNMLFFHRLNLTSGRPNMTMRPPKSLGLLREPPKRLSGSLRRNPLPLNYLSWMIPLSRR